MKNEDVLRAWMGKRWLPPTFRKTRGNGTITYTCLDGCPGNLGCTIILRGGCQSELKAVKRAAAFCINVAYNLRLEISYLNNRCATLPYGSIPHSNGENRYIVSRGSPSNAAAAISDEELKEHHDGAASGSPPLSKFPNHLLSSSLCIDFGDPPPEARMGGTVSPSTPYGHQGINVTSLWMTSKTQCCQYEVKTINYYCAQRDVSLGQFLQESCFNSKLKCHNVTCKRGVRDHILSLIHGTGRIDISVGIFPMALSQCIVSSKGSGAVKDEEEGGGGGETDTELLSKGSGSGGGLNAEDEGGGNVKTTYQRVVAAAQRGEVEGGFNSQNKTGGEVSI